MDIVNLFIQKNVTTLDKNNQELNFKNIKELFISSENINNLSRILYRELYLPNNETLFNQIKGKVIEYTTIWVESNKLDKYIQEINDSNNNVNDLNEQVRYLNSLFIKFYKFKFLKTSDFMEHEIDNNPYKHIYEYKMIKKKNSDILADDYGYVTFNNYNDKYTTNLQFSKKYNEIPYYERGLYSQNIDKKDNGSFRERKLVNNNYKKYNNDELFNNINYLKK